MNMYEAMEKAGIKICPDCGKEYTTRPAISRKDNKTEVCPDCGRAEAVKDFEEYVNGKKS